MHFRVLMALVTLVLASLGLPSAAVAHSRVVSSVPAQDASVAAPRAITLNFDVAQLPPSAAASIVMTAMPGMADHGEMAIRNFTSTWSNGNRTLTLNLRQPLHAGSYEVRWQSAGSDGHSVSGTVAFTVR